MRSLRHTLCPQELLVSMLLPVEQKPVFASQSRLICLHPARKQPAKHAQQDQPLLTVAISMAAGGLADLRTSLEQGLGLPVSHPTLDILLNEQAELKVCARSCNTIPSLYPSCCMCTHTHHALLFTANLGLALVRRMCI